MAPPSEDRYDRPAGERPASERSVRSLRALLGVVGVLAVVAIVLGAIALVSVPEEQPREEDSAVTERLRELGGQLDSLRQRIGDLVGDRGQPAPDTGQEEERLRNRVDELENRVRELQDNVPSVPSLPDAVP